MSELPNYDAYKLATPAYLEGNPDCQCGHDFLDHDGKWPGCDECDCQSYTEPDPQADADDARLAKWERDR